MYCNFLLYLYSLHGTSVSISWTLSIWYILNPLNEVLSYLFVDPFVCEYYCVFLFDHVYYFT